MFLAGVRGGSPEPEEQSRERGDERKAPKKPWGRGGSPEPEERWWDPGGERQQHKKL